MELENISLGGHSHGGFLVSYIAHERPKLVKNLIMINSLNGTTPIPPEPEGLKYIYGPKGHPNPIPTIENTRNNQLEGTFNKHLVTDEKVKLFKERNRKTSLLNEKKREGSKLEKDKKERKIILTEIKRDKGSFSSELRNKRVCNYEPEFRVGQLGAVSKC